MILGLKRGSVGLVPYQAGWGLAFAEEKNRLASLLGRDALQIEHIGSTAVPGLAAKPLIDVAVAVPSLRAIESWPTILQPLGYTSFGDREGWGEYFFAKGSDERRTIYLHAVPLDSDRWKDYLWFRDALSASPALRLEYAELKRNAADTYPEDRLSYTAAKSTWIRKVLDDRRVSASPALRRYDGDPPCAAQSTESGR